MSNSYSFYDTTVPTLRGIAQSAIGFLSVAKEEISKGNTTSEKEILPKCQFAGANQSTGDNRSTWGSLLLLLSLGLALIHTLSLSTLSSEFRRMAYFPPVQFFFFFFV